MATSATVLLIRDELVGFARTKTMLVLWLLMPALALAGFLLLPDSLHLADPNEPVSATAFITFFQSSIAGLIAGLMTAVDLVSEKSRNVHVLLAIRPIRREAIVWAKFFSVAVCVIAACLVSVVLGLTVDVLRGEPVTGAMVYDAFKSILMLINTIALSAAAGVTVGVMSRTILVAVLLVLYGGQNLAILPLIPVWLGFPNTYWLLMVISAVIVLLLMWGAGAMFRRAQL